MMSETGTQILDLAERAMRTRGYHAVSFRDLADDMGIKSASVHYHFRRKEDLGAAVVDRYANRVAEALGEPTAWVEAVTRFCNVYRAALNDQKLQCLCGMLAAESPGLPSIVSDRVAAFYNANIEWLAASMPDSIIDKRLVALDVQARIQGAMTLAVNLGDPSVLDDLAERLIDQETN